MNDQIYEKYNLSPKIDREVDVDELDVEWFEHTNMFGDYSDAYAIASKKRDDAKLAVERAKENVDKVKAEIGLDIRANPNEYDLTKVTDASVEACIKTQDKYQKVMEDYFAAWEKHNQAKYESDVLGGAVKTMEQRKFSLENAIRLMTMQYFDTPNEPKDDPKARQKIRKMERARARQKIMEAMDDEEGAKAPKKRKRKSVK